VWELFEEACHNGIAAAATDGGCTYVGLRTNVHSALERMKCLSDSTLAVLCNVINDGEPVYCCRCPSSAPDLDLREGYMFLKE